MFSRASPIPALHIAEPIPMKRELKLNMSVRQFEKIPENCRAYPDEKGIETYVFLYYPQISERVLHCRAYPDEKGIETPYQDGQQASGQDVLQSLSR